MNEPLLLTVKAAAAYAGVSRHLAYELCHTGAWATLACGRRILVARRSIEDWAERIAREAADEGEP